MFTLKDITSYEVQQDQSSPNLSRVLVGLEGTWHGHKNGTFTITPEIMRQLKSNFDSKKIDVVCDFEHQTLTGDTAPASGWIKELEIEEGSDGMKLYAHVEWTDEAKAMIESKQYRYVSPVYDPATTAQQSGSNIGWSLHSLSLTNTPFLEELGEVIANKAKMQDEIKKLKDDNIALKARAEDAEQKLKEAQDGLIVNRVDALILARKITPLQRDAAITMAKEAPKSFDSFMAGNRPFVTIPKNDMLVNKDTIGNHTGLELNAIAAGLK